MGTACRAPLAPLQVEARARPGGQAEGVQDQYGRRCPQRAGWGPTLTPRYSPRPLPSGRGPLLKLGAWTRSCGRDPLIALGAARAGLARLALRAKGPGRRRCRRGTQRLFRTPPRVLRVTALVSLAPPTPGTLRYRTTTPPPSRAPRSMLGIASSRVGPPIKEGKVGPYEVLEVTIFAHCT